jgi:hypothetical protein
MPMKQLLHSPQPPVAPLPRKAALTARGVALRGRGAKCVTRAGLRWRQVQRVALRGKGAKCVTRAGLRWRQVQRVALRGRGAFIAASGAFEQARRHQLHLPQNRHADFGGGREGVYFTALGMT